MAHALSVHWVRLAPRERTFVAAGALVLVVTLAWAAIAGPFAPDLGRSARDAERAAQRLAQARVDASAAQARRAAPAQGAADAGIRAALVQRRIGATDATVAGTASRATLTLPSVRFEELVGLVDALARDQALHVAEATILPRVEPGRVRAELVLAR